jgi:Icc-related predicted phosphoesterase
MRLVLISDTHNQHASLSVPDGDVLIHAGDISDVGKLSDLQSFNTWLGRLPHKHKLVIAGNHDFCLERDAAASEAALTNCTYLKDSGLVIDGIKFYGSPWQPEFYDYAFNLPRGAALKAKWDLIPKDVDVLITHGPPQGYGDLTRQGDRAGCFDLLDAVKVLQPRLHVYGHIHEGAGRYQVGRTILVNASSCDPDYHPTNPPIVFDI